MKRKPIQVTVEEAEETKEKKQKRTRAISQIIQNIKLSSVGVVVLSALLARAGILGDMYPFGGAYFAMVFAGGFRYLLIPLICVVEWLTGADPFSVFGHALSMLLFALVSVQWRAWVRKNPVTLGGTFFACHFAAGLLILLGSTPLLYDVARLLLESLFAGMATAAFAYAKSPILDFKNRTYLSPQEVAGVSASAGLVLLGSAHILEIGSFRLTAALAVLAVLLFALKYGGGMAAAAGTAVGFFVGIGSFMTAEAVSAFAVSGLVAGLFSRYRKWGVCLGFLFANAIFTIVTNGSTEVIISLYEILAAVALVAVIPRRVLDKYGGFSVPERADRYDVKIRTAAAHKLACVSSSFDQLEQAFLDLKEKKTPTHNVETTLMFERTANRVCNQCGLRRRCWKTDLSDSLSAMKAMLKHVKTKGELTRDSLPPWFQENCVRQDELCEVFNAMYEIYKVDVLWGNRVDESRHIMAAQLGQMAQVVGTLAEEIQEGISFDDKMEAVLFRELQHEGIHVESVNAGKNRIGRMEVILKLKPCGGFGQCRNRVLPVVSEALGREMELIDGAVCGACEVKYSEAANFVVRTGTARRKAERSKASGDHYGLVRLDDGRFVAVLSDGMGTGKQAAKESEAAVRLVERLLAAGFDQTVAVGLVNSVLVSRGVESNLTSIDLCIVDLIQGQASFTKVGATASFIRSANCTEQITANGSAKEQETVPLSDGDMIILASDGLVGAGQAGWLRECASQFTGTHPQALADFLMDCAKQNADEGLMDDMTCVVLRIVRNRPEENRESESVSLSV